MAEEELTALIKRVAAHAKTAANDEFIRECTHEAVALVDQHIGAAANVPKPMRERAIVETAADLFWRRNTQSGIATFQSGESLELMRVGADPLHAARIILRPWTGVPIA